MKSPRDLLLEPDFLERLWALREQAFRIRRKREIHGLGAGQAPEFDSHRSYEPGDEPRYIDWNIYARLEKLLLKMYVVDEQTQVSVLVDMSRSMRDPAPKKEVMALRLAAAFSYLALAAGHQLVVGGFADTLLTATGPHRSLRQFPAVLDFLSGLPEGKGTDLSRALGEFFLRYRGKSLLLVVSDFFQEGDVIAEMDRLLSRRTDLHLVQVVDDAELHPSFRGENAVLDIEGDREMSLFVGHDLLEGLRGLIREYLASLGVACRDRGVPYLLARTSRPFDQIVLDHLVGAPSRDGKPA